MHLVLQNLDLERTPKICLHGEELRLPGMMINSTAGREGAGVLVDERYHDHLGTVMACLRNIL